MRLYSRNDLLLMAGLTAAVLVVFSHPLSRLIKLASDIEQSWGLNLISGLIILTVIMVLHAQGRRQELRAQARAASAEVRIAQDRAQELERLVSFGAALARALDLTAIHNEVLRNFPHLAGRDDGWVVVRAGAHWESLIGATGADKEATDVRRERITELFFKPGPEGSKEGDWIDVEGEMCFPLVAGGRPMGLLGVPIAAGVLTDGQRRVLAAAGSALAIAIRNADLFREVRDNSLRDGLTGCFNRTHAIETLTIELRRAYRSRRALSAIMFDLDHFKLVNDQHGHQCGDEVLAAVGRRLREVLRSSDVKCRYGGEEFLVVLPETPIEGARRVADTLLREIAGLRVAWGNETVSITASLGVTVTAPSELDAAAVVARADAALYRAKDDGRNCVRETPAPDAERPPVNVT